MFENPHAKTLSMRDGHDLLRIHCSNEDRNELVKLCRWVPCCDWARKSVPHRSRSWKRSSTPKMPHLQQKRGVKCVHDWVWIEHNVIQERRDYIFEMAIAAISKLESFRAWKFATTAKLIYTTSEAHRFEQWPHLVDLDLRNSPGISLVPLIPTKAIEDFQPTMQEYFDICSCWVWRAISWWIWFPDASFHMRDVYVGLKYYI